MRALRMADRVACFTHHVRDEIIRLSLAEERHVVVLPGSGDGTGQLSETMQAAGEQSLDAANPQISIDQTKHFGGLEAVNLGLAELRRHGLVRHKYFHFAADFTEPSNHKLLLTAFGLFRARHPDSEWRLVCSGATNEVLEQLKRAAQLMGLGRDAIFASEGQMASRWAIMQSCGVVLFCGLETTTTISLVDALQLGKPMICSDLAGIPQAVHAAALGIDPKKPIEIAGALEQVATDETLLLTLAERSKNQAQALGGSRGAATRLLEVFQEAMESTRTLTPAFKGLFADGWTSNRFELTWPPARGRQTLNLKLFAPKLVRGRMRLHLLPNRLNPGKTFGLKRGRTTAIRLALPEHGGSLTFIVDPPIIPKELSINNDARVLGCLCRECTITGKSSRLDLHAAPLWPPVMATAVANSPVAGVYAPRTAVADCPTESLSFQELASSAGGGRQP
jgi:hypothetical protein